MSFDPQSATIEISPPISDALTVAPPVMVETVAQEAASPLELLLAEASVNNLLAQAIEAEKAAHDSAPEDLAQAQAAVADAKSNLTTIQSAKNGGAPLKRTELNRNVRQLAESVEKVTTEIEGDVGEHHSQISGKQSLTIAKAEQAQSKAAASAATHRAGGTTRKYPFPNFNLQKDDGNDDHAPGARRPRRVDRVQADSDEQEENIRRNVARTENDASKRGAAKRIAVAAITTTSLFNGANLIDGASELAAEYGALGMNKKAVDTGKRMTNTVRNGTVEEKIYAAGEIVDVFERRVLGTTFVEQEVEAALDDLNKDKKLVAKHGGWFGLSQSEVMEKLRQNGYIQGESGGMFGDKNANSRWSHAIVKRLDFDGDGQVTWQEIKAAMSESIQQRTQKIAKKADDAFDKGLDKNAAASKLGKQILALGLLDDFQAYKDNYDADKDGISELHEIVAKLNSRGIKELKNMDGDKDIDINDVRLMYNAKPKAPTKTNSH